MSDYKEMYEDLLHSYKRQGWKIEELEKENSDLRKELDNAERRIYNELEPRIESENRVYDQQITSQFKGSNGEPCQQYCPTCINDGCENNPEYNGAE